MKSIKTQTSIEQAFKCIEEALESINAQRRNNMSNHNKTQMLLKTIENH